MIKRFSLVAVIGGACLAADSQMEGPKLGFAYDRQAAAVRPILGIPGAAVFGAPLISDLRQAVVSPSQTFAIGVFGSGSTTGILNLASGELIALEGAMAAPTRIVFSPNGSSVALVKGIAVQVFMGLPASAKPEAVYELAAEPAAIAVSDDGALLLAAIVESEEATALYSYGTDGAAHRILSAGRISSIQFLNKSHDAVFADAGQNQIVLLRNGADATLVGAVEKPGAVASTADNRKVLVASSASRSVTMISLEDGSSIVTACGCEPTSLARLQDGAIFRMTEINDGPTWILDTNAAEPKALFIPHAGVVNE